VATFLKFEGIDGESEVRGKKGFMELASVSFGATRNVSAVGAGTRGEGDVRVQEVNCTRVSDSVSALLFTECVSGDMSKKAEIEFVRTGPNNKPITFMSVLLEGCGISAYSVAGNDGIPIESFSLAFSKITIKTFQVTDKLAAVPFTGTFDLLAGKP
jgi:type VI protein secretion system component Hcp